MAKKVKQAGKNTLILLMICVVVFMAYIVYKTFGNQIVELLHLLEHGDQEELKAYLEAQSTVGGFAVLWLICVMQVVSIVFPSMVIQVAGALIYGWWRSFIVCWVGFVSGNVIAFTIGRLFKKNIATLIHKDGEKENWIIQKINQGHQIFVVAIACMVPGVPCTKWNHSIPIRTDNNHSEGIFDCGCGKQLDPGVIKLHGRTFPGKWAVFIHGICICN